MKELTGKNSPEFIFGKAVHVLSQKYHFETVQR